MARTVFAGAPSPAAAPALRGKLVLIRPDGSEGPSHELREGSGTIGRETGSLFGGDSYLSPRHATFTLRPGGMTVRDEESLNGVYVKLGREQPVEVQDGDVFRMGQELVRFEAIPAPKVENDGTERMGSPTEGYWGRIALVVGRDTLGNAFPIGSEGVVLGRERGDILFPEDGYVSGTHARLYSEGGKCYLKDLGSSNGTFLRIRREQPVQPGDYLLMGQQLFKVDY